jgi:hypothetical protein
MTWSLIVNYGEPLTLHSLMEVRSCVAAAHMGLGVDTNIAIGLGSDAMVAAKDQQERRKFYVNTPPLSHRQQMNDGTWLEVRSSDRPEEPHQYCKNLDGDGGHCARHLNHLGEC